MSWQLFLMVFGTVFVAELGDKTQVATLLFATDAEVNRWLVFAASSLALIVSSGLGVVAGTLLTEVVNLKYLQIVAGLAFLAIGAVTLIAALRM